LGDGEQIAARQVVATIDARDTFGTLIDRSELPKRWMRRIRTTDLSISTSNLYLGTDLDVASFGAAMENDVWPTWDLEEAFRTEPGNATADVTVTIPTLVDPSLAPPGHHQVVIMATADDDPTNDPDADAAHYVRLAEQVIPGLDDHIIYALGAQHGLSGPDSLPLHRIDAIYGWSNTPGNSGPFRLPQTTPIDGLYLAGQWTQPGEGIWTVIASGLQIARILLDRAPASGLNPLNL
jgi:prolycopene isomerase